MLDNLTHADTAFFTQNDLCNNILNFGTLYEEHSHKSRKLCNLQKYMPKKHLSNSIFIQNQAIIWTVEEWSIVPPDSIILPVKWLIILQNH